MKKLTNPICSIAKAALAVASLASMNAVAGSPSPGKEIKEVVEPEAKPWISGTLEAGWDSRYYFRGLWFADNTTWAGLNVSIPLVENLTLGLGALYTSTVDTDVGIGFEDQLDYSELDLIGSLTYDFKFMKLAAVYTNYHFFDTFSGRTNAGSFGRGEYAVLTVPEAGIVASTSIVGLNLYGAWYYDFNISGSYFEVGADYPVKVTDWLSFVPAVKSGYGLDYYSNGNPENGGLVGGVTSGITHVLFSVAAPMAVTKNATVTPYCAWNISGHSRQSNNFTDNEVFGGVKVGVSF